MTTEMPRRDALQALLAPLLPAGSEYEGIWIDEIPPDPLAICFVISGADRISDAGLKHLNDAVRLAFADTPYSKTPVIILGTGLDFSVIRLPETPNNDHEEVPKAAPPGRAVSAR